MRILWVKAGRLLPVDTGGKIRSYNILKHLATRHEMQLVSYFDGDPDPSYQDALRREFPNALGLWSGQRLQGAASKALQYLSCLPSAAPYTVRKYLVHEVTALVTKWLAEGRFDVAVCDFLAPAMNFPPHSTTPVLLFQHNVESALWDRQARQERHVVRRVVFSLEASKMRRYETEALGRFERVIAVSEHDRAQFLAMAPSATVTVVPTGVDVHAFRPRSQSANSDSRVVLFLGSMDWRPNIDAVEWFCEAIWPRVRERVPDAIFRVVGRDPELRVRKLASASVEIVGRVPSVQEYLHRSAVVVVPLRVGGGTPLKIFEAMASARAVVSTRIGAEGLDVEDEANVLLRDDPAGFADAVVRVLQNPGERRRLELAALSLAERYDWANVAQQFEDVLLQAVAHPANGRPSLRSSLGQ